MEDNTITGAVIGVIGTIIGVVLGLCFSLFRDIYKEKTERKRLARLLILEIQFVSNLILYGSTVINRFLRGEEKLPPKYEDIENYFIHEHLVYRNSISLLKLLPLETCAVVVEFFSEFENCKHRSHSLDSIVIIKENELPDNFNSENMETIDQYDGDKILVPLISPHREILDYLRHCATLAKKSLLQLVEIVDLDQTHLTELVELLKFLDELERNVYDSVLPDDYVHIQLKEPAINVTPN